MKILLFIAILLSIALASYGQSYTYNRLVVMQYGDDNFGYDNRIEKDVTGSIVLGEGEITIDDKTIKLKREVSENVYAGKGCTIRLFYREEDKLRGIQVKKLNRDYYYCIDCNAKSSIVAQK